MEASNSSDDITFVCISDTHNRADTLTLPPGDVLIHAGDFTYLGTPEEVDTFNAFLSKQNFQYKVIIAGNHELSFDEDNFENFLKNNFQPYYAQHNIDPSLFKSSEIKARLKDCIYLEDSSCEIFGYKIYGSPWVPNYHEWAFNVERGEKILKKWKKIPDNTDILITHGPPKNILDETRNGFHSGCEDLLREVMTRIKPKYHIFGHVHETYGHIVEQGINFINASTCTITYEPINKPIVFKLPRKN